MNYFEGSSVISFDDTQTISSHKSHATAASSNSSSENQGVDLFDKGYPLNDEIMRRAPASEFLTAIYVVISTLQAIITSYFPFMHGRFDYSRKVERVFVYFVYLIDFGSMKPEILDTGATIIVIIMVFVISLAWHVYINVIFHNTKSLSSVSVRVTRVFSSFLHPLLVIPTSANLGLSIERALKEHSVSFIFATIFLAIAYIYFILFVYIDFLYRGATPYIEHTIISAWDGSIVAQNFLGCSIATFASIFIRDMPIWTNYLLITLYFIMHLYLMYKIFYLPFMIHFINSIYLAGLTQSLIACILPTFPQVPRSIALSIPLGIGVLSTPIFYLILKNVIKRVGKNPQYNTEIQAIRTMRIFMAYRGEEFVKWKLIKDITQAIPTSTVLVRIAQMIAFFPAEETILNIYISILNKRTDLKIHERFLLYQIKRVHILRQSSTTKSLIRDLKNVKQMSSEMFSRLSVFYVRIAEGQPSDFSTLMRLSKMNQKVLSCFKEALETYPNNAQIAYEYSKYLIECNGSFKEGIRSYQKAKLIERGRSNAIDYCFVSMASLFPDYIKKRILNHKGQSLSRKMKNDDNSAMNDDLADIEIEDNEEIALHVIEKPKLRFALRRALDNMQCKEINFMKVYSVVRAFFIILWLIIIFGLWYDLFENRSEDASILNWSSDVRYHFDLLFFGIAARWIRKLNLYPEHDDLYNFFGFEPNDCGGIVFADDDIERIGFFADLTLTEILNLSYSLTVLFESKEGLPSLSKAFIGIRSLTQCNPGTQLTPVNFSTSVYREMIYINSVYKSNSSVVESFNRNPFMCESLMNYNKIMDGMSEQSNNYIERSYFTTRSFKEKYMLIFTISQPILLFIFIVPAIVSIIGAKKEIMNFYNALQRTKKETLKEASKPICKALSMEHTMITQVKITGINSARVLIILIQIVIAVSFVLVNLLLLLKIIETANNTSKVDVWIYYGSKRCSLIIEILNNLFYILITKNNSDINYVSPYFFCQNFMKKMRELIDISQKLTKGDGKFTACKGYDPVLDQIHFGNKCNEIITTTFHDNYACLSLDELIWAFEKLGCDVDHLIHTDGIDLKVEPAFIHFIHMGMNHLFELANETKYRISEGYDLFSINYQRFLIEVLAIGITCFIIFFGLEQIVINAYVKTSEFQRVILSRIPPLSVISNHALLDIIIGKSHSSNHKDVSIAEAIVYFYSQPMIAFNNEGIMLGMNPITNEIFGFTEEQMGGQHLSYLFSPEDVEKISQTAKLENENKFIQITGIRDDGQKIEIEAFLMKICNDYVIHMTDQTKLNKSKKDLLLLQEKSEMLMENLMPAEIIRKINQGEQNPQFSVKSATTIFINIVKFTDFTISLGSKFIISNIETVFKAFDNARKKYESINKIKIMGDIYFAISGLFGTNSNHALDVVSFALDCLKSLNDTNQNLCTQFMVRIGICTGGPIHAAVLGDTKQTFEVFGNSISIAKELENRAEPSQILMTRETKDSFVEFKDIIHDYGKIMISGESIKVSSIEYNFPI